MGGTPYGRDAIWAGRHMGGTPYGRDAIWALDAYGVWGMSVTTLVYIANLKESQGNPYSYRVQVQIHRFTISIMVRFLSATSYTHKLGLVM